MKNYKLVLDIPKYHKNVFNIYGFNISLFNEETIQS